MTRDTYRLSPLGLGLSLTALVLIWFSSAIAFVQQGDGLSLFAAVLAPAAINGLVQASFDHPGESPEA